MTKEGSRLRAEERFKKAQRTDESARTITQTERDAVRNKTDRLREQRLNKEAAEEVSRLDKKPSTARKRPKSKA
jgi:hypothetical protein